MLLKMSFRVTFHEALLKSLWDLLKFVKNREKRAWATFLVHFARNTIETLTRFAPLVSNDSLLESKVVTDEPGRLGRPAGRPGLASPAARSRPAGRWAALQGNEGRAKEGGSAPAEPCPPTPITAGGLFSKGESNNAFP